MNRPCRFTLAFSRVYKTDFGNASDLCEGTHHFVTLHAKLAVPQEESNHGMSWSPTLGGRAGPDLLNDAGHFVSRHHGIFRERKEALLHIEVTVADFAGVYADEHFARFRSGTARSSMTIEDCGSATAAFHDSPS